MRNIVHLFILLFITLGHQYGSAQGKLFEEKQLRGVENVRDNNAVAVADYNMDGNLDFYVVSTSSNDEDRPETFSRLFQNNNDATFLDVTEQAGLLGIYDYEVNMPWLPYNFSGEVRHGASWGDYDNDGDPDLFLVNYKYNQLFANQGDGTFLDVTTQSNLMDTAACYSTSAAWLDYNNDGWLDLLVSSWAFCKNKLYENTGDGSFLNVSDKIDLDEETHTWMVLPMDINADQRVDLLLINDFGFNKLLVNQNGGFIDQTEKYGMKVVDERNNMGSDYADVNNDGLLDVYISDIAFNSLWLNQDGYFIDVSKELEVDYSDWSWQTKLKDMDWDGDLDILVVNGYDGRFGNYFFQNELQYGSLAFTDQSKSSGFDRISNSMCFETFDYDHDGDLDVLATDLERPPFFLENQTAEHSDTHGRHWVKIALEGTTSNRSAIGTRVSIRTSDNRAVQQKYYTGVGFMTQSLQPLLFGLDTASKVMELAVIWPSGTVETYSNLPVDVTIELTENIGYEVVSRESYKMPGCTDPNSCSFNPIATIDDGSCSYITSKSISGPSKSGILQVDTYSYPIEPGNSIHWQVTGGKILEGHDSPSISVQWDIGRRGEVSVYEIGECHSPEVSLDVELSPEMRNEDYSVARLWNETILEGIRNDLARPTVHARNLFHASVLMYDLYAFFTGRGTTYYAYPELMEVREELLSNYTEGRTAALEEAISYGIQSLMTSRFSHSPGQFETLWLMRDLMLQLGYDPNDDSDNFRSGKAGALGNYVAQRMIERGFQDGANEMDLYKNEYYEPVNTPLTPDLPGNPSCENPNRWQPLQLVEFIDQSGHVQGNTPEFLSPEWGNVNGFALTENELSRYSRDAHTYAVYYDPGAPPKLSFGVVSNTDDYYKWGFSLVSIWSGHLDPNDGVNWDISPGSIGNLSIADFPDDWADFSDFYHTIQGGDPGQGHAQNPITGEPYKTQMVPRGDYTRVLAEFWADGPDSETPPGHWFTLFNYVSDQPQLEKRFTGEGRIYSDMEWDIKGYFVLAGALHDAAISAWSIKGWHDYVRPISAIRYMADQGQSSDPQLANYHPLGIPLVEGRIEVVLEEDPLAGDSGEHVGKIKLWSWRGHDYVDDPDTEQAGVGWILAENWWPYQRPSFVTPPFAGYVSGHSTFSRAAAEVLTLMTGSPYFPGGMGEFHAKKDEFLVFEQGPSVDVVLQWATYRDAADQCSLSRIWGGIHPPADDLPGRFIGEKVGIAAFEKALTYFGQYLTSVTQKPTKGPFILPNPMTTNHFAVDGVGKEVSIRLFDLGGKPIRIAQFMGPSETREVEIRQEVPNGVYLVQVGKRYLKLLIRK